MCLPEKWCLGQASSGVGCDGKPAEQITVLVPAKREREKEMRMRARESERMISWLKSCWSENIELVSDRLVKWASGEIHYVGGYDNCHYVEGYEHCLGSTGIPMIRGSDLPLSDSGAARAHSVRQASLSWYWVGAEQAAGIDSDLSGSSSDGHVQVTPSLTCQSHKRALQCWAGLLPDSDNESDLLSESGWSKVLTLQHANTLVSQYEPSVGSNMKPFAKGGLLNLFSLGPGWFYAILSLDNVPM